MRHNYLISWFCGCLLLLGASSCKKYLDTKSDKKLSTPETLKDLQALLDNPNFYKRGPNVANTGTDEYYLLQANWETLIETSKKAYVWDPELNDLDDWSLPYENIFYANTILDKIKDIPPGSSQSSWNLIKGAALFHRAHAFYQVAQLYAPPYDPASSSTDPGIVLRLDADFNKESARASVKDTYLRIIQDLTEARELLSPLPNFKTSPSQASCYALLARVNLILGNYENAKSAADECLRLQHSLIDYNDPMQVNPALNEPFMTFDKNPEIIFFLNTDAPVNGGSRAKIDTSLYKAYQSGDLRKDAYFRRNADGSYRFKGSYSGSFSLGLFNGLSVDEVILTRAECHARLNNKEAALDDLNELLGKRWETSAFVRVTASTPREALTIILAERKKELLNRGIRWSDIRRLNKENGFQQTLTRDLNGVLYRLPPNDLRFTLLIPRQVITQTNLTQNER